MSSCFQESLRLTFLSTNRKNVLIVLTIRTERGKILIDHNAVVSASNWSCSSLFLRLQVKWYHAIRAWEETRLCCLAAGEPFRSRKGALAFPARVNNNHKE